MKYFVYLMFAFSLIGCTNVTYLENGATSDDCSSSVEISTTGITTTNQCSDRESVTKIKVG